MGRFDGKRVVITGAAGIYGTWLAEAFAREGARLLLTDMRESDLDRLAQQLSGETDAHTVAGDLRDPATIESLVTTVQELWASPDIVVNNAGVYPHQYFHDMSLDDWMNVINLNLTAPFLLMRDLSRLMIQQGVAGCFVNITSGAANTTRPGSGHYSTSKAGLAMLTRAFALELAPHGIRVNAVSPGFTPGSEVSHLNDDYTEMMTRTIPLGRVSGPHDSSEAVMYLCSDAASYITGTTLTVDGGRSAGTFGAPVTR